MPLLTHIRIVPVGTLAAALMLWSVTAQGVMDRRFELAPTLLTEAKKVVKPRMALSKPSKEPRGNKATVGPQQGAVYTVKRGDNLFKIMMRNYGLSNDEAEAFIEEVRLENNILDIKRLKVGQKIVVPPVRRDPDGTLKFRHAAQSSPIPNADYVVPRQLFSLEAPTIDASAGESLKRVRDVWQQIVPSGVDEKVPVTLQTPSFSLTLDPVRFPVYARMDGGRIVLDQDGAIPPLVKSLIEEKDASVHIIAGPPLQPKRFMATLLAEGGFFSVEENFTMEFGADPKLTVKSDFKVEKTADSLLKQDVTLVSSGRAFLPLSLNRFLKQEGFSLYEPFASRSSIAGGDSRTVHFISGRNQPELLDALLSAVSVIPERGHRVDVFGGGNGGISLAVKADRYFERGGEKYIVTSFDGDPVNHSLFRILEARGYTVIVLDAHDDFRRLSEKIFSQLKIKGTYALHDIFQNSSAEYSVQMSGFKLDDPQLPGGGIFLTDRTMSPIFKDLFAEHGLIVK